MLCDLVTGLEYPEGLLLAHRRVLPHLEEGRGYQASCDLYRESFCCTGYGENLMDPPSTFASVHGAAIPGSWKYRNPNPRIEGKMSSILDQLWA